MPLFETWTFNGARFLALSIGSNYFITDRSGNSYGAWQTIKRFRDEQRKGSDMAKPIGEIREYGVYTK